MALERAAARHRRRVVLGLVVAYVWATAALAGTTVDPPAPLAPPLSLPDLDGRTRSLQEFLSARPVLLEFMSTGCPHCRDMGPVLARLHAAYGNRVTFLTVAFDRGAMRVRSFARVHGHQWSYLLGNEETVRAYELEGVPTFYLLGADGRIRGRQVGSSSYEELARALEAALRSP
ncbi:MAG: TlpA family protein disulfide reductase [Candidatus Methylomirabilales bacterium]